MRLLIVLSLLISFSARAEFVGADPLRVIIEEVQASRLAKNTGKVVETLGRSMRILGAKANTRIGYDALLAEKYVIVGGREQGSQSVVMRTLPAHADVINVIEGRAIPGISDGELELGFFDLANGTMKEKVQDLINHHGERSVLDQAMRGRQQTIGTEIFNFDGGKIEALLVEEISKTPGLKLQWNDILIAAPKIVKVDKDIYGTVRTIRINIENLSANQVRFMIESLAAKL